MGTEKKVTRFEKVNLVMANVRGNLELDGAKIDGELVAHSLKVAGNLFMRAAVFGQPALMHYAHVGANLDIRGATLATLDLSGASINGELSLGWKDAEHATTLWLTEDNKPGDLILRNTRVANLMDAQNAWPERRHLHLDGFAFAFTGLGRFHELKRASDRPIDWWDDWLRRDPDYSPFPYQQLAAAFAASGERDKADAIRYLGRVREREKLEPLSQSWFWSYPLQYVVGFGLYPFKVLYWVIGISLFGALYLWRCAKGAQGKGFVWCYGASLTRLLPGIEITKEFSEFFKDPERERLTGWQSFVFSVIAVVGWVLSFILVAAVTGLITGKL